jgi:hypothetical protein
MPLRLPVLCYSVGGMLHLTLPMPCPASLCLCLAFIAALCPCVQSTALHFNAFALPSLPCQAITRQCRSYRGHAFALCSLPCLGSTFDGYAFAWLCAATPFPCGALLDRASAWLGCAAHCRGCTLPCPCGSVLRRAWPLHHWSLLRAAFPLPFCSLRSGTMPTLRISIPRLSTSARCDTLRWPKLRISLRFAAMPAPCLALRRPRFA